MITVFILYSNRRVYISSKNRERKSKNKNQSNKKLALNNTSIKMVAGD